MDAKKFFFIFWNYEFHINLGFPIYWNLAFPSMFWIKITKICIYMLKKFKICTYSKNTQNMHLHMQVCKCITIRSLIITMRVANSDNNPFLSLRLAKKSYWFRFSVNDSLNLKYFWLKTDVKITGNYINTIRSFK